MRYSRRGVLAVGLASALILLPACSASVDNGERPSGDGGGDREVEVFSWWAGPGEKEGLDAMIADFTSKNSEIRFNNAAVAGGGGGNAKTILTTRLQAKKPPDSYQVHAGKELAADIQAGYVEDLTPMYDREGWREKFPKGLVDAITVDGEIYSVPVNIHRSNLLWFNPTTLKSAGIAAPPLTWDEFLTQAETLKEKKITALAIGPGWAQKHLLENVLLGELGPERYLGLFDGSVDWKSAEVVAALSTYTEVLGVSDIRSAAADWQPAMDRIVDGTAAYSVMGDWADGYLKGAKGLKFKSGYDVVASPGTKGVYNFLSDSFTLPVGAPHRSAAEKWLVECGSVAGQDLFNPRKGSIPARTDADRSRYTGYLAAALVEWQNPATRIVGSLTHGVVANNAWNGEIDAALAVFARDRNVEKFAGAVATAYEDTK